MVYKFFNKRSKGSGTVTNEPQYQLAHDLHKPIIRKFKKIKVCSSFRYNTWGVDLADMQSLSKYNKGIRYLLCAIGLFSKYAWVVPLKDKKGTIIVTAFKKYSQNKENQIKYGLIKAVNFVIIPLKFF